jgi:hypothetical protein
MTWVRFAQGYGKGAVERRELENLERVLVGVAPDREAAPVGAEDRGLVAIGVQD